MGHRAVQKTFLNQQLAHVGSAGAAGSLIGHGREPLYEIGAEKPAQSHQHQADRTVASDEILLAVLQSLVDDATVDRIEDDDRIVLHPKGRSGIDPVAVPPLLAQFRVNSLGVVATLAGDDDIELLQLLDVLGFLQGAGIHRCRLAGLRCREEDRLDADAKISLLHHPLKEDRTYHTAPTYYSDFHSLSPFSCICFDL